MASKYLKSRVDMRKWRTTMPQCPRLRPRLLVTEDCLGFYLFVSLACVGVPCPDPGFLQTLEAKVGLVVEPCPPAGGYNHFVNNDDLLSEVADEESTPGRGVKSSTLRIVCQVVELLQEFPLGPGIFLGTSSSFIKLVFLLRSDADFSDDLDVLAVKGEVAYRHPSGTWIIMPHPRNIRI
ncbi:hypothetical protein BCR34DRAFT_587089 [Clohesyomyces aquaticus]|uniref:Uncharacterized protein n=1 Tax=Clohesyomyces aquaticus TaxID=1231657 RepID=A0A1Y1ZQT1_9PLEO|nr:hypothetical protein BCR34DRAFT_587089 [Clohesyomyces aquaticus]